MIVLECEVNQQVININKVHDIVEGTQEIYTISFTFDNEWEGMQKTVIFQNGNKFGFSILDDTNVAKIPKSVIYNGNLFFGVQGNKDGKVLTTKKNKAIYIRESGGMMELIDDIPETSEFNKLMDRMANIEVLFNDSTKHIEELTEKNDKTNEDIVKMTDLVVKSKEYVEQLFSFGGAGFHNSIFRGKYLGDNVTDEQFEEIEKGTFNDLFIGDYWTINGVDWIIGHFNYYFNRGGNYNTKCKTNHIVIIPREGLFSSKMNEEASNTQYGYLESDFYKEEWGLQRCKDIIISTFGENHILEHSKLYPVSLNTNGYAQRYSEHKVTVELMNEINVFGCNFFTNRKAPNSTAVAFDAVDNMQYMYFKYKYFSKNFYLRDIGSSSEFIIAGPYIGTAHNEQRIVPYFCLCKESKGYGEV